MPENNFLYVFLEMHIPEAGLHHGTYAELEPLGTEQDPCTIRRFIELSDGSITGGKKGDLSFNLLVEPQEKVPHPSQYAAFSDIEAKEITQEEFNSHWAALCELYPELKN